MSTSPANKTIKMHQLFNTYKNHLMTNTTLFALIAKFNGDNKPTIGELKGGLQNLMRGQDFHFMGKDYNLLKPWEGEIPSDHPTLRKLINNLPIQEVTE